MASPWLHILTGHLHTSYLICKKAEGQCDLGAISYHPFPILKVYCQITLSHVRSRIDRQQASSARHWEHLLIVVPDVLLILIRAKCKSDHDYATASSASQVEGSH